MTGILTGLVAIFVLLSLSLIVTVPVALATPGEWEDSKANINKGFQLWVSLVVLIATLDGISASN